MSGTILLADDSLTIQKVVELTFADTDNAVVTVSSGDELLAKLPAVAPDLVICDVIMPGTDGYSVCQTIKSNPSTLHIPVVLLTGTFEPFDKDRALAAGCDEIITKPFEARKLVDTVEGLLRGTPEATEETPSVEPPPSPQQFEGAVMPPGGADAPVADEFGTRLAPPSEMPAEGPVAQAPDTAEGMDFTTTGFAEMEAAGRQNEEQAYETPSEGLEFDLEEAQPLTDREAAERTAPPPFEPAEAEVGGDEPGEPFSPSEGSASDVAAPPPPPSFGEPEEPFDEATPSAEAAEEPPVGSVTEPVEVPPPGTFHVPPPLDQEEADREPEDEAAAEEEPVSTPEPEPAGPAAGVEPSAPAGPLSEEDIERIARRVVELFAARLEQIAWEVIPDVAEIVVRERVRQIEAEAEKDQPEATY